MSSNKKRTLELLAPARNDSVAVSAILAGADAVYIGASSHGARHTAANSIDAIRRVVEAAHPYRAKVYATVNTLVYDRELIEVERLINQLYHAGVDALIVQDMGLLRL
ncbi:MAG: collagenase-like protease, partial [Duncaniella sp.]|nr:collagenase-like protease [Duncaniella sp.]